MGNNRSKPMVTYMKFTPPHSNTVWLGYYICKNSLLGVAGSRGYLGEGCASTPMLTYMKSTHESVILKHSVDMLNVAPLC